MWKCSNDKVLCYHCDKYGHTKEKCFKCIVHQTYWKDRITCFECNETGPIARDFPRNHEDRKSDGKESNIYIF